MMITCTACEANASYPIKDYLAELSFQSGIGYSMNFEENFSGLSDWGIVDQSDRELLDKDLDYNYLGKTISRLLESDDIGLNVLKNKGYIDRNIDGNKKVDKATAKLVIEKAVEAINNKEIITHYDFEFKEEVKDKKDDLKDGDIVLDDNKFYVVEKTTEDQIIYEREAEFDEVYAWLDIEDSFEIDFTKAEVISYGDEESSLNYRNNYYTLLSSNNHVFNKDGFRISYTLNRSGIDVHISKNVKGLNVYCDASINNVKPTFKWKAKEDDLKNSYFKISFNSTEELGLSTGKYGNYHLKFKDLDKSSFRSLLRSMVEPMDDEVEASIPICQIKTPIPELPTAFLNLDLYVKIYASGKIELVLYNTHELGYETKDGQIRFINDNTHRLDSIIQASGKAALAVNMSLEAVGMRLCDIEVDGGLKAVLQSILHMYDDEGNLESHDSNIAYSTLSEISKDNPNVKVCADVSLYWLLDMVINTSKTKMNKLGLSKTFHILDDDNQVFGNMHHIENGHFVKKCTYGKREGLMSMDKVSSNKIVLDSYAEVLKINETYEIVVKGLPEGYKVTDLLYSSGDDKIARVSSGTITAVSPGSVKIKVSTKDDKYNAYVNILVSTG